MIKNGNSTEDVANENIESHIMVDIEGLGIETGSVILSIGACIFDPWSDEIPRPFSM